MVTRCLLYGTTFSSILYGLGNKEHYLGFFQGKRALLSVTMDEQAATKENINIILWSIQVV